MPHRAPFLERISTWATKKTGTSGAFALAVAVIVIWLASGPFFHYSDTWQLVINTGTTIVTFLMVFLIQRGQNKDSMPCGSSHAAAERRPHCTMHNDFGSPGNS